MQVTNLSQNEIDIVEAEQKAEMRIFLNINNSKQVILYLLNDYSSLSRFERVLTRILRFIFNCKVDQTRRRYGNISADEIRSANQLLIIETQAVYFADELSDLKASRQIKSCSKLLPLSPFIDQNGLLRMGSRIQNSTAMFDTKHPMLLPSESRFARLLFEREHRRLLHAGPQALLYAIHEKYWPIKGKNITRKTVHNYIICFRNNPKPLSQIMGQLPAD